MKIKRVIIVLSILIVLLMLTGGVCFYNRYTHTFSEVVKSNWNIELPENYHEIYKTNDGISFNGDGIRYHVLQYDNLEAIKEMVNWQSTDVVRIDSKVKMLLKNLDIPSEYEINWQDEYKYYYKAQEDLSIIYFILVEDLGRVYIIENFQ